jgi:acylphosphatase
VQGVAFRAFTRRQAHRLGLAGWVRNERDGSVRLVAEGPRYALERLLLAVHEGPPGARVDDVMAAWSAATGEFDGFGVRFR